MQWIRVALRMTALTLLSVAGVVLTLCMRLAGGRHWYRRPMGQQVVRRWMRTAAFLFGVRMRVEGQAVPGLWVSNHVSFLDVIVLDSVHPARFVAKHEILHWPIIGLLARISGTLFLRRGSSSAVHQLNRDVEDTLQAGGSVAVFPEGTTSDGRDVLKFHAALLQAAIHARAVIQPVAIRYLRNGEPDTIAPFINNDRFGYRAIQILRQPYTEVHVRLLPTVTVQDQHRRALAEDIENRIRQAVTGT